MALFRRDDHKVAAEQALIRSNVGDPYHRDIGIEEVRLRVSITHPPVEGGLRVPAIGRGLDRQNPHLRQLPGSNR